MPELVEQMYCSQQIVIPPKFPYILKRYCKAAIKTQPYDLLRWSYEYFLALAQHRPPPVKLRLEYPVFSTEGGLTRGCLKVLAQQLGGMTELPLQAAKAAWAGFCLDSHELRRIFCLCEVHMRSETVPFLHFIAVAGGLLTKSLTNTMILLCETLTKEPDGGSAAISVNDFLTMYNFLARIDASENHKYFNGYREGEEPPPEETVEEEQTEEAVDDTQDDSSADFWAEDTEGLQLQKLSLINAHVSRGTRLSQKLNQPITGRIERSPSMERAGQIERENYLRERKGIAPRSQDVDEKLREMSEARIPLQSAKDDTTKKREEKEVGKKKEGVEIFVYDENDVEIPYEFYGQPHEGQRIEEELGTEQEYNAVKPPEKEGEHKAEEIDVTDAKKIDLLVAELYKARKERLEDLEVTFEEIAEYVDRFQTANYDLGMVAGRQMSTTSGEFIVQHIEQDIMAFVDEQIAVLPDPDLKKKKAKPEEIAMIRDLLDTFLDENMDVIVPEIEEVEEEEAPIPDIIQVYAVPGIGPRVDEDIIKEFEEYALDVCKVQADMLMPRNIRHFLCPPLEKYVEKEYETKSEKKEEVATGGVLTE